VVASNSTSYLPCSSTPLQSITAATSHRVPEPFLRRAVHARGRTPTVTGGSCASGYRNVTRGWAPKFGRGSRASPRQAPEGAGSPNAFHSRFGPVLGLGPMSSHLAVGDGRASRVELRHLWLASQRGGDACSGMNRRLRGSSNRSPSRLSATESLSGCPTASSGQRDRQSVAEVTRRLPYTDDPPRWGPGKTRSGNTMTPPMGFVSFRRGEPR